MPYYIQFNRGFAQGVTYYSTPPVGYHSALAAKRLSEHEVQVNAIKDAGERAKHTGSLQILRDERDALLRQEWEFMAKLVAEGLDLYEVPPGEDPAGMYIEEDVPVDPGDLSKGKRRVTRVNSAFEARAKTWRKLSLVVPP